MALQGQTSDVNGRNLPAIGVRWTQAQASSATHAIELNRLARDVASEVGDGHGCGPT